MGSGESAEATAVFLKKYYGEGPFWKQTSSRAIIRSTGYESPSRFTWARTM